MTAQSIIPGGYNDPDAPGNSHLFYSDRPCIEYGCDLPAGTAWSHLWCFRHNVQRIDRISTQLDALTDRNEP